MRSRNLLITLLALLALVLMVSSMTAFAQAQRRPTGCYTVDGTVGKTFQMDHQVKLRICPEYFAQ